MGRLIMVALGSDFVGYTLKQAMIDYMEEQNIPYKDYGTYDTNRCDYPVYAYRVAKAVQEGQCACGILFCGTGVGMSIAANKIKGIRCVCCSEPYSAKMAREHNDANILALGARVIGPELAKMIVAQWLDADFSGQQHKERVAMIRQLEENGMLDDMKE